MRKKLLFAFVVLAIASSCTQDDEYDPSAALEKFLTMLTNKQWTYQSGGIDTDGNLNSMEITFEGASGIPACRRSDQLKFSRDTGLVGYKGEITRAVKCNQNDPTTRYFEWELPGGIDGGTIRMSDGFANIPGVYTFEDISETYLRLSKDTMINGVKRRMVINFQ